MLIDYHLHNHFSPDSDANTPEILKNIQRLGIRDVCFTNHMEWFEKESPSHVGRFSYEEALRRFESIQWEINLLQPQFPNIAIRLGAEITYNPDDLSDIERLTGAIDFDFLLGSVHNIDGFIINSHLAGAHEYFAGKNEEEAYGKYFNQLADLVRWGQFDVVAHLDVIKKYGHEFYGHFQPEKYKKEIMAVLEIVKQKGLGIELNSRSLHKRCKELFPHPEILKWALEIGVEHFTLSSDAHTAEDAGYYVREALDIANEAGIKTVSTYEKRKAKKQVI